MKKRILSLLLILAMCITLAAPAKVYAAENVPAESNEFVLFSKWAVPDLMYGETYGIYPTSWNEIGFKGSISQAKFRVLLAGIRLKVLGTECATESRMLKPVIDNSLTVEEVLKACYTVLYNYDYTVDLGLNNKLTPVAYMKQKGIYTGENGEQDLKDRCSIEQALVIATRVITFVYNTLDVASKGFLWEVKSGDNTVYLLGSIHMASYSIYPFSDAMLKAYRSSDALIVEADLYDQADVTAYSQMLIYTDGTTLKDHISAESYKKIVETAALFGLTEEVIALMKPWTMAFLLESFALAGNVDADKIVTTLGIDMTFLNNAYAYQKPVYPIESLTKQATIFDSFSAGLQELMLNYDIDMINDMVNGTEDDTMDLNEYADLMLEYWHDGDVEAFKALSSETDTDYFEGEQSVEIQKYMAEYEDKIMTQRDKGMAEFVVNLLNAEGSTTYFVIVGSAHYISDYSVLDILKEKGYTISQIK